MVTSQRLAVVQVVWKEFRIRSKLNKESDRGKILCVFPPSTFIIIIIIIVIIIIISVSVLHLDTRIGRIAYKREFTIIFIT